MANNIDYHSILHSYDPFESAYHYLEQTYGAHTPYTLPDLVGLLVLCLERGTDEEDFKREAESTYIL